jgi:hypothetical protein
LSPAEWAGFVAATLSCCALIVGGLRYIIRHEVPAILEASNIVSRIDKLEALVRAGYGEDRARWYIEEQLRLPDWVIQNPNHSPYEDEDEDED